MSVADESLMELGLKYYVAARSAARMHLLPITGNLFHLAVEMVLKSDLAQTATLKKIRKEYDHDLQKIWDAFKVNHTGEDLSPLDSAIEKLSEFGKIRYPDKVIDDGALIHIWWIPRGARPFEHVCGPTAPEYTLNIHDVDDLIDRVFNIRRINAAYYFRKLNEEATEAAKFNNESWARWNVEPAKDVNPLHRFL
jgi:hypothetical protein